MGDWVSQPREEDDDDDDDDPGDEPAFRFHDGTLETVFQFNDEDEAQK